MSSQTLIGLAGAGLIAANEWTSGNKGVWSGVVWNKDTPPADAHAAVRRLGVELLFVVVLVVVAGVNPSWSTAILAALAALWVLWGINHYGKATP